MNCPYVHKRASHPSFLHGAQKWWTTHCRHVTGLETQRRTIGKIHHVFYVSRFLLSFPMTVPSRQLEMGFCRFKSLYSCILSLVLYELLSLHTDVNMMHMINVCWMSCYRHKWIHLFTFKTVDCYFAEKRHKDRYSGDKRDLFEDFSNGPWMFFSSCGFYTVSDIQYFILQK